MQFKIIMLLTNRKIQVKQLKFVPYTYARLTLGKQFERNKFIDLFNCRRNKDKLDKMFYFRVIFWYRGRVVGT